MSFTELKKLHWLLSNGHFSVISERALVEVRTKPFDSTKTEHIYKEVAFIKHLPNFVTKVFDKHNPNDEWHMAPNYTRRPDMSQNWGRPRKR